MDTEKVRNYCLQKAGVTEGTPFGEDVLVYKVMGKIFCLLSLDTPFSVNLKCDPELAVEMREKYESVQPGYHMNKTHWNTVTFDGSVPDKIIQEWIDHSYLIVVSGLSKKLRAALNENQ